ncbi:unnamed protein product [Pedinophyceae sp. YPF-701]|nr:unnamed protein product [Pedinophyceae sp. YPF-701]
MPGPEVPPAEAAEAIAGVVGGTAAKAAVQDDKSQKLAGAGQGNDSPAVVPGQRTPTDTTETHSSGASDRDEAASQGSEPKRPRQTNSQEPAAPPQGRKRKRKHTPHSAVAQGTGAPDMIRPPSPAPAAPPQGAAPPRQGKKHIGVCYYQHLERPWRAQIRVDQELKNLGGFYTEGEAARAYDRYVLDHRVLHARRRHLRRLNFPDEAKEELAAIEADGIDIGENHAGARAADGQGGAGAGGAAGAGAGAGAHPAQRARRASQYRNVYCRTAPQGELWFVELNASGQRVSLGSFRTEEAAACARDMHIVRNNITDTRTGALRPLNFPDRLEKYMEEVANGAAAGGAEGPNAGGGAATGHKPVTRQQTSRQRGSTPGSGRGRTPGGSPSASGNPTPHASPGLRAAPHGDAGRHAPALPRAHGLRAASGPPKNYSLPRLNAACILQGMTAARDDGDAIEPALPPANRMSPHGHPMQGHGGMFAPHMDAHLAMHQGYVAPHAFPPGAQAHGAAAFGFGAQAQAQAHHNGHHGENVPSPKEATRPVQPIASPAVQARSGGDLTNSATPTGPGGTQEQHRVSPLIAPTLHHMHPLLSQMQQSGLLPAAPGAAAAAPAPAAASAPAAGDATPNEAAGNAQGVQTALARVADAAGALSAWSEGQLCGNVFTLQGLLAVLGSSVAPSVLQAVQSVAGMLREVRGGAAHVCRALGGSPGASAAGGGAPAVGGMWPAAALVQEARGGCGQLGALVRELHRTAEDAWLQLSQSDAQLGKRMEELINAVCGDAQRLHVELSQALEAAAAVTGAA